MTEHFKIDCNIVDDRRAIAAIAWFEIIGRIPLMDKATGKEYR